jgi:hypothetical protein
MFAAAKRSNQEDRGLSYKTPRESRRWILHQNSQKRPNSFVGLHLAVLRGVSVQHGSKSVSRFTRRDSFSNPLLNHAQSINFSPKTLSWQYFITYVDYNLIIGSVLHSYCLLKGSIMMMEQKGQTDKQAISHPSVAEECAFMIQLSLGRSNSRKIILPTLTFSLYALVIGSRKTRDVRRITTCLTLYKHLSRFQSF